MWGLMAPAIGQPREEEGGEKAEERKRQKGGDGEAGKGEGWGVPLGFWTGGGSKFRAVAGRGGKWLPPLRDPFCLCRWESGAANLCVSIVSVQFRALSRCELQLCWSLGTFVCKSPELRKLQQVANRVWSLNSTPGRDPNLAPQIWSSLHGARLGFFRGNPPGGGDWGVLPSLPTAGRTAGQCRGASEWLWKTRFELYKCALECGFRWTLKSGNQLLLSCPFCLLRLLQSRVS